MTRKVLLNTLFIFTVLALLSPIVLAGSRSGRFDQEVQAQVQRILGEEKAFANVSASVDDGIVILRGGVAVIGDRTRLEYKVRTVEHVAGVRSELAITTFVADDQLYNRILGELATPRFAGLPLQVRNGVVTIEGTVSTLSDHADAIYILENTPGVKGIDDHIVVIG